MSYPPVFHWNELYISPSSWNFEIRLLRRTRSCGKSCCLRGYATALTLQTVFTLFTVTTENSDGNLVKGSANYNGLYKFGRLTVIFIRTQIFSIVCCPVWCFLIWSLQLHCKFELREHILDSACPQCLQYWAHDPHIKILVGWLLVGLILFFFFLWIWLTLQSVLWFFWVSHW